MRCLAAIAVFAAFVLFSGAPRSAVVSAPRRIVSLNPCLDAILLAVADHSQIAALSRYSQKPSQSAVAAEARGYPFTDGSGEEIVALKPDLVLGSGMGSIELTHVLPRLKIRQVSFSVPVTIDESLAQILTMSRLVGHPDRGFC